MFRSPSSQQRGPFLCSDSIFKLFPRSLSASRNNGSAWGAWGSRYSVPQSAARLSPARFWDIPGPSSGSRKRRWPGRQRLLPMQLATFEINPFCIMQRMPPLLWLATPHPSPETNHCRARACTSPPPPCRAARSYRAALAAARRLLKGGSRPLKDPRARRTAAPFPAGARRARPRPRGAQARPGALPPSAPPPGAAFLFRRRLREPGGARCIVGAAESRSREEAEGAKRTGKRLARGGGARHQA